MATATETNKVRLTPVECKTVDGCWCFTPEGLKVISEKYVELKKCRISLSENQQFIHNQYTDSTATHVAWWQEPQWVVSGMIVSFSVGALFTYIVVNP